MIYLQYEAPYYATIAAISKEEANKSYSALIAGSEEENATRLITYLSRENFLLEISKCISEETGKPIGMREALEQLEKFESTNNKQLVELFGIENSFV